MLRYTLQGTKPSRTQTVITKNERDEGRRTVVLAQLERASARMITEVPVCKDCLKSLELGTTEACLRALLRRRSLVTINRRVVCYDGLKMYFGHYSPSLPPLVVPRPTAVDF